jgi:hypothetical protein
MQWIVVTLFIGIIIGRMSHTLVPNNVRRRFRFGIGAMLVAVAVLCLWLSSEGDRVIRQQELVNWVEEHGGRVAYDYEFDEEGKFISNAALPGPEWARKRLGIHYLANVVGVDLFLIGQVTDSFSTRGI